MKSTTISVRVGRRHPIRPAILSSRKRGSTYPRLSMLALAYSCSLLHSVRVSVERRRSPTSMEKKTLQIVVDGTN